MSVSLVAMVCALVEKRKMKRGTRKRRKRGTSAGADHFLVKLYR